MRPRVLQFISPNRLTAKPLKASLLVLGFSLSAIGCSSGGDNKKPSDAAKSAQATTSESSSSLASSTSSARTSSSNDSTLSSEANQSSSSSISLPEPSTGNTILLGNVFKGTVRNADVSLYAITNGIISTTPFNTVTSDEQGEFTAEVATNALPTSVYVTARAKNDGSTTMICDAKLCGVATEGVDSNGDGFITLGEPLTLDEDFILTGAFTPSNDDTWKASITPWSHAALKAVKNGQQLSIAQINQQFMAAANLLRLPMTLGQLTAASPTSGFFDPNDKIAALYGIYSSVFATYAIENDLSISEAIEAITNSVMNDQALFRQLLDFALENATAWSEYDQRVAGTINAVQLTRNYYRCGQIHTQDSCPTPPPTTTPTPTPTPPATPDEPSDENDLVLVKGFVADLREWLRTFTVIDDLPLEGLQSRGYLVADLWENDVSHFGDALNGILRGLGQTVNPTFDFCQRCDNGGFPEELGNGNRVLEYDGLLYNLQSDGHMTIDGKKGDVSISLALQIPTFSNGFQQQQTIEILSGSLERDSTQLNFSEGSFIRADYPFSLSFSQIAEQLASPFYFTSRPDAFTLAANFNLTSTFTVIPPASISFEPDEVNDVRFSGDWRTDSSRASDGDISYRARSIRDGQRSQTQFSFETAGGEFTFDYALSTEGNFDFLNVYINGGRVLSRSGFQNNFQRFTRRLNAGRHTVRFEYSKDGSVSSGADTVWIDNIQLPQPTEQNGQVTEIVTQPVMTGYLEATAHRTSDSLFQQNGYRSGNLTIDALLDNSYTQSFANNSTQAGTEQIRLSLSSTLANAATFLSPGPLDRSTLVELGRYETVDDVFEYTLDDDQTIQISLYSEFGNDAEYRMLVTQDGFTDTQFFYRPKDALHIIAGDLINNSGIGREIIVPGEGSYRVTLLNASPFGFYPESQFTAEGGSIFGVLTRAENRKESPDQYLDLSASAEITLTVDNLGPVTLGVDLTRLNLDNADLTLSFAAEDNRFSLESNLFYQQNIRRDFDITNAATLQAPTLKITNQEGITLELSLSEDIDAKAERPLDYLTGTISYKGTDYGTITRARNLTVIRYSDGTGESLE